MSKIQITCDTPEAFIYYSINNEDLNILYSGPFNAENGNVIKAIGKKDGYDDSEISEFEVTPQLISVSVGNTYTIDGIEVLCIKEGQAYTTGNNVLIDDGSVSEVTEHPIFVDKNHDLCYYFTGSDYVDESETSSVINSSNKYGYEWGGYGIITEINDQSIGSGLLNTNSLIDMKLQPYEEGWNILGDKVEEFRQLYSDKWFVPSLQELDVIYNNKSNLKGLTVIDNSKLNPYYWSSCEFDPEYMGRVVHAICLTNGNHHSAGKEAHFFRCRLCRQI